MLVCVHNQVWVCFASVCQCSLDCISSLLVTMANAGSDTEDVPPPTDWAILVDDEVEYLIDASTADELHLSHRVLSKTVYMLEGRFTRTQLVDWANDTTQSEKIGDALISTTQITADQWPEFADFVPRGLATLSKPRFIAFKTAIFAAVVLQDVTKAQQILLQFEWD